jgi:hypothetical protein
VLKYLNDLESFSRADSLFPRLFQGFSTPRLTRSPPLFGGEAYFEAPRSKSQHINSDIILQLSNEQSNSLTVLEVDRHHCENGIATETLENDNYDTIAIQRGTP